MNTFEIVASTVRKAFDKEGLQDSDIILSNTKNIDFGDYQVNGVMGAAKHRKTNPRELAQKVADNLMEDAKSPDSPIEKAEVAGPGFINLRLKDSHFDKAVTKMLGDPHLDVAKTRKDDVIILDYSSPNLAKEMHVGHLRSTIIGDSISRISSFLGAKVVPQNHVGDWGTQFGMLIAYMEEEEKLKGGADSVGKFEIKDLEEFYRNAKKRFDEDEDFANFARERVYALQHGDPKIMELWKKFVDASLVHANDIYERLGVLLKGVPVMGESMYNYDLPLVVDDLLKKGIAEEKDGTVLVYFEDERTQDDKEPLGYIIRKNDGSYLYSTTDLSTIRHAVGELKGNKLWYVVDKRQASHFDHLFAIARKAGYLPENVEALHIPFGTMMGEDGKPFKTRTGGTVKLAELLDEALSRSEELVKSKNPDLPADKIKEIARKVGIGAVKYADLSKNRQSDYVFKWDGMLSFEGNTAPYLQYAYTRVRSLLKKAGDFEKEGGVGLDQTVERELALALIQFEEIVEESFKNTAPHILAGHVYKVAQVFSKFYEACPILNSEEPARSQRLRLALLSSMVAKTGLELLGIEVMEEM